MPLRQKCSCGCGKWTRKLLCSARKTGGTLRGAALVLAKFRQSDVAGAGAADGSRSATPVTVKGATRAGAATPPTDEPLEPESPVETNIIAAAPPADQPQLPESLVETALDLAGAAPEPDDSSDVLLRKRARELEADNVALNQEVAVLRRKLKKLEDSPGLGFPFFTHRLSQQPAAL